MNTESDDTIEQPLINKKTSLNKQSIASKRSQISNEQQYELLQESESGFMQQAYLLIYKNLILTFKNPKNLVFLILTPFLLSGFMFLFQSLARENGKRVRVETPQIDFSTFPKCFGEGCISIDYRILSQTENYTPPWVQYTLDYIKSETGFTVEDFQTGANIATVDQLQKLYKYHKTYQNRTQIGLLFCDGTIKDDWINQFYCNSQTADYSYYLVLNKSDSLAVVFHDILQPIPIDQVSASLKLLIDNAIHSYLYTQKADISKRVKKISFNKKQFPVGENKYIDNYDMVTTIGAFYYLITPLFAFLFIQNEIVRQKQYRLRQGLNIFGAGHLSYWTSWFVVSNVYSILVAVSTYFAGLVFGFGFFTQTPFYIIIFFLFYPFTLSLQMLSYFISTLAPSLKASNTVSYALMLFAIVVESFSSDNTLITFIFTEDANTVVTFLKYFFWFYPPFSYTKIFTNITQYSGYHFSFTERRWVESPINYDLSRFTEDIQGPLPFGGSLYYRYSDMKSMFILYGDVIFFIILTWYFDHVIASNRGRSEPFYYPFNKIIQKFRPKQVVNQIDQEDNVKHGGLSIQEEEQSAVKQRNKVNNRSRARAPAFGLRIKNLSKTFTTLFSRQKVQALKKFTLQIEPNELMGILGHNGAGKTTLINILTGILTPDDSQGLEIIIDNNPISNISQIRKHIGVCSQFDILWNELTAEQHLYMFALLKGIKKQKVDQRIDQMLSFVNLLPQKKVRVGRFSGGMKRRLSLAIAAIGNPKIILLDQPTTGLDPKVRQQVWNLIQKLKKGKSIILTTHSMQQADILADRISVVVKGRLKCIGSTLYLKKTYGQGHRIAINLKSQQDEETVVSRIHKLFPNIKALDCRGGSLIMGASDYNDLLHLVKKLESKESMGLDEYEIKNCIKAWGVSHTTLQQVFMKVSKEKEQ